MLVPDNEKLWTRDIIQRLCPAPGTINFLFVSALSFSCCMDDVAREGVRKGNNRGAELINQSQSLDSRYIQIQYLFLLQSGH